MASEGQRLRNEKEYLIPPGSYMYVQDATSGKVKIYVGPIQVSLTGNDAPMTYDHIDGKGGDYDVVDTLEMAVRKNVVVPEGHYVVLTNPAVKVDGKISSPSEGSLASATPELSIGLKVILRGPYTFPLWPGQDAQVIPGHNLRSNQYVLCRVYNQTQAQKNWGDVFLVKAAPRPVTSSVEGGATETSAAADAAAAVEAESDAEMTAEQLIEGKLFIIRGTQAAFYIPPTGVAVVADENGAYVREAVTLEQLEYSVLRDEAGTKRYVKGPAVVFPQPTEKFMLGDKGEVKTRAIEMNNIQGIHIKATREHHDLVLGHLKEGEERFVTGKEYPIYYPREEQVLVRYDGNDKYFAVAVTEGRGRYVMDRMAGVVHLALGPTMLLPDPVTKIIVRRVLTRQQCELWYPGNDRVLAYNEDLAGAAARSPTTRTGVLSEGDYERATLSNRVRGAAPVTKGLMDTSSVGSSKGRAIGDEITRGSTYNAPRTLVLNADFEGAPGISPWTGFAVMVVDSKGDRRVVVGPSNILLEFDETLEILTLSTNKPKNADLLFHTPYLRVENNGVSDIITVETADNVLIDVKVCYLVNFVGSGEERLRWFAVQNYVKMLCDRMRSRLKAKVKSLTIETFYGDSTDIIRKVVLGVDEKGTVFVENNMYVSEVEVLEVSIQDKEVEGLLRSTQKETVQRSIRLASMRREVAAEMEEGKLNVASAQADAEVKQAQNALAKDVLVDDLVLMLARLKALVDEQEARKVAVVAEQGVLDLTSESVLAREEKERTMRAHLAEVELSVRLDADIKKLEAEAEAQLKRLSGLTGGFTEALLVLSSQEALVKITQAGSVQKMLGGENALDVVNQMFSGNGLGRVLEAIAKRSALPAVPNGQPVPQPLNR